MRHQPQRLLNPLLDGSKRVAALDVLRGFALCGVLLVNISAMGRSLIWNLPPGAPSAADPSWRVWLVEQLLVEGAMRGLFTLLFGAGVLYITRRADRPDAPVAVADVYLRRCLGLMGLGLANVMLLAWPGDILFAYGLTGLCLFPFRLCRTRTLVALGMVLVLMLTGLRLAADAPRLRALQAGEQAAVALARGDPATPEDRRALAASREIVVHSGPDPAALDAETRARTGGPVAMVTWSCTVWAGLTLNPVIAPGLLECAAFMLFGMVLLRTGVLGGVRSSAFYAGLALLGLAAAFALRGVLAWQSWVGYGRPTAMGGLLQILLYEPGRAALTLAWLGAVLLAWKHLPQAAFAPLRALGRTALTNYLGQSVIGLLLFRVAGLYGRLDWPALWALAVLICAMQAAFSLIWLGRFRMGPAEWVLRSLAYGQRQAIRLHDVAET